MLSENPHWSEWFPAWCSSWSCLKTEWNFWVSKENKLKNPIGWPPIDHIVEQAGHSCREQASTMCLCPRWHRDSWWALLKCLQKLKQPSICYGRGCGRWGSALQRQQGSKCCAWGVQGVQAKWVMMPHFLSLVIWGFWKIRLVTFWVFRSLVYVCLFFSCVFQRQWSSKARSHELCRFCVAPDFGGRQKERYKVWLISVS